MNVYEYRFVNQPEVGDVIVLDPKEKKRVADLLLFERYYGPWYWRLTAHRAMRTARRPTLIKRSVS